jgi:Lar family restriction alleviation protein
MTEPELKPCPFCNGKPLYCTGIFGMSGHGYYIQCNDCGAESHMDIDDKQAIEAWNKRV